MRCCWLRPAHTGLVNMAKLSILVNRFLRDFYTSTDKPATTYEKYLRMLEDWSLPMPPNLRHCPDHLAGETDSTFSTIDNKAAATPRSSLQVYYS